MRRVRYKKVRKVQPNFYEYTGVHNTDPVEMQLFVYDDDGYEEYKNVSLQRVQKELEDPLQADDVKWLNIHGLYDVDLIKKIGEMLTIEPFIIGDILNTNRRSKMEELDQVLYFSIKSILPTEDYDNLRVEQISFFCATIYWCRFRRKRVIFLRTSANASKPTAALSGKRKMIIC